MNKELKETGERLLKFARKSFSCEPDAKKAADEIEKKFKFVLQTSREVTVKEKFGRGRKAKDAKPEKYEYFITMSAERDAVAVRIAKEEKSMFVIVTNDLEREWTPADLLKNYKSQQRFERGFRFMKEPEFFSDSFFLKKPERIESPLMIMVTSLFVYSSTEFIIRKKAEKPEQNPAESA